MKIYHNPRCRKSRETLSIIHEHNVNIHVIDYLKMPPTEQEIRSILTMLNISAFDLIRKDEKLFKKLYRGKQFTEDKWVTILHENPILIQRPIVIKDSFAIIGRPPINVLDLLT